MEYKTTSEIEVPKTLIKQVIGQDHALEIVKKASKHRRHVLLIGEPGTGKSMLGLALAEMLPTKGKLEDTLIYPNQKDQHNPIVKTFPAGEGEKTIVKFRKMLESGIAFRRIILFIIIAAIIGVGGYYMWRMVADTEFGIIALVNAGSSVLFLGFMILLLSSRAPGALGALKGLAMVPKPLVTHKQGDKAPFQDATGAHAGALLGDVLHDPFQSGGFGTPAHERVMPGMIHKAHKGVLFIDEIATLKIESQQDLLTALQERKFPITGQSEKSSGSMVRTEPVPCDFILVAAGNLEVMKNLHPALRSRIRGYGYETYMNETMVDNEENRKKLIQFVAQEIKNDGRTPPFKKEAVEEIIQEARKRANRKNHLTLRLRGLGGLIRAAGDVAKDNGVNLVSREHVLAAMNSARPLEQQIADKIIDHKKQYELLTTKGTRVGRVNGLAVIGSGAMLSGIILPIEAAVTSSGKNPEFIATGKLGEIANEAITNVRAVIKKHFGQDIKSKNDVFIQFMQTYEGVEGDSASIAVATSVISALKNLPIRQDTAMTGSLAVRGEVLPVGGVTAKVNATIDAGIKRVIVPQANFKDIVISKDKLKQIKIIPVNRIEEVLKEAIDWKGKKTLLNKISKSIEKNI